jgi:endonuclease/exonuclease/phosphatase family metal-dependent hydrolase
MTRLFAPMLLALTLWTGGQRTDPLTIRVLTYNIHHGQGMDGLFNLPRLAGVILSCHPDIVALQEVDAGTERSGQVNQLAELQRLTGMDAVFGKAMDFSGGTYGVGVLSRWPILDSENHPLPASADREPRTALTVKLRLGERGPLLRFTSTHLDQSRDPANRLAQARHLNRVLAGETIPSIVAGDMNTRTDAELMEIFDAQWTNAALNPAPEAPTGRPRLPVDRVLFRPIDRWRVVESRVVDEPLASDHRPLLVVLEWTEAP